MANLGSGWLAQNLSLPSHNHGVFVPRFSELEQAPFPTRTEEYWFAAQALEEQLRGLIVDAGCGFNPEIHVLPEILTKMGYEVYAIDANPAVLGMPAVAGVQRRCGTMAFLQDVPNEAAEHWVCISVLEHLEPSLRMAALHEAYRVLTSGGLLIMTMDAIDPERLNQMVVEMGFEVGPLVPLVGTPISPPVSWVVARKP